MTERGARSRRRIVAEIIWLLMLAGMMLAVWPARFGGDVSFVVVRGDSMEPHYHSGDLIYARSAEHFDVGDIAVYRQPNVIGTGHSLVIHRLIERLDDGRWVLRGDNREFADDTRPTGDDLVARPVLNLGPWPTQFLLRLPLLLSIVVGVTVIWWRWPRGGEGDGSDDAVGRPNAAADTATSETLAAPSSTPPAERSRRRRPQKVGSSPGP